MAKWPSDEDEDKWRWNARDPEPLDALRVLERGGEWQSTYIMVLEEQCS